MRRRNDTVKKNSSLAAHSHFYNVCGCTLQDERSEIAHTLDVCIYIYMRLMGKREKEGAREEGLGGVCIHIAGAS